MKDSGIMRRVDSLGRFVLPKELRRQLQIECNDYLQIYTEGEKIIIQKGFAYRGKSLMCEALFRFMENRCIADVLLSRGFGMFQQLRSYLLCSAFYCS